jgi:hypothetical protein
VITLADLDAMDREHESANGSAGSGASGRGGCINEAARLDIELFLATLELARRRERLATEFLRLARQYRELAMQAGDRAEEAIRRFANELEPADEFDRLEVAILAELEKRDERGAA